MKNKLLYLLTPILFCIGCSSEMELSDIIVGTWSWESLEIECVDPELSLPLTTVDENNCILNDESLICNFVFTFQEGNMAGYTVTSEGEQETLNFTYTVNDEDETIELCRPDLPGEECMTIQANDDTFFFDFNEDDCLATFVFRKA